MFTKGHGLKYALSDFLAAVVYWTLSRLSLVINRFGKVGRLLAELLPLTYYKDKSFHVMRNDCLDRFGTPLERRFTRQEIKQMLKQEGMRNITFSDKRPFWHVIAQRAA